jgi:hypothetical protein
LSIDSGVILAYYLGEDLGQVVRDHIFEATGREVFHNRLCVAELCYVLCRRRGITLAAEYTKSYIDAEHSTLTSSDDVDVTAATYKCERAISLADCYVIAVAKLKLATALFARHEDDLDEETRRKPFDVPIVFLEDLKRLPPST